MSTTTINVDANTTPRHSATIDAGALIQALRGVLPHAGDEPEVVAVHRVRLDVRGDELQALATNRFTAAVVRVDGDGVVESDDLDPWVVDLFPEDLATVAKMFKPGKDEQITLRIDQGQDDRVTITDVSGLFDGRAYTIPAVGHPEDFPRLRRLISQTMASDRGIVGTVTYTGDLLRRFAASAAAYNDKLHVEPTRENKPFVVTIGERFIGLLMPAASTDEVTHEQAKVRSDWWTRLTEDDEISA